MSQTDNQKDNAVLTTIRMLIPTRKQHEAIEILTAVSAQVQFEPHCIYSRLYRGLDDTRAIMIEERWSNDEQLRRHLQSDAYHRVLQVIEMAEELPEIRFESISTSAGVEKIEKARRQSK